MTDSLFDLFTIHPQPDTTRHDAARQAAQEGIESAEMNADPEWFQSALDAIRDMPTGRTFLAEEIVCALREKGIETHDARAAGAVMKAAASHKLCRKIGYAPAHSSNSSPKTLWLKVAP